MQMHMTRGLMLAPLIATLAGSNMQRNRRVPFAIWVMLWAIIVIAALALIITVVAWFTIP